jgi:Flp pilus assembly protein CpaB
MTERARNIVIAAVLAVIAALLTGLYVTNYQRHVQQGEEHVSVFVATRDIPAGTSGADAISQGMVTQHNVVRRAVVPGAISNTDQISQLVASQTVFEGEQITLRRFSNSAVQGIRGELKGTMRAFQVQGDENQLLTGTLRSGDHVDLVATFKYKVSGETSGDAHIATRTVLRDLKVLRPPTANGNSGVTNGFNGRTAAILALTDTQVQKLNFVVATAEGGAAPSWSLSLRPPVKADDSPESITTLSSVLRDGLRPAQLGQLYRNFGGAQ